MLSDFSPNSDSLNGSVERSYHEANGYREEGDYTLWEPTDYTQLEPETREYGPGAMTVGEIDSYDWSDCEEF